MTFSHRIKLCRFTQAILSSYAGDLHKRSLLEPFLHNFAAPDRSLLLIKTSAMASNRMDRLHSLMMNADPTDNPVAETPGGLITGEGAPVNWGTEGNPVRPYLSGASDSSDGEYAARRSTQKKKKKTKPSRPLADIVDQDEQKRSLGDISPSGMGFVPILALAKYPYKFLLASPSIVDSVSKGFFAAEKFWGRKWTV